MFQKIGAPGARSPRWMHPAVISLSVAVHFALAAGIAALPTRPPPVAASLETATFLVLFQADRAPVLPSRAHAGPGGSRHTRRGPEAGAGDAAPLRAPAPAPPLSRAGAPVVVVPRPVPGLAADPQSLLVLAAAVAGPRAARFAAHGRPAGAMELRSSIVAAEMLAELPRLVNEREVTRTLRRLYPPGLRHDGVQGEVALTFIIGMDGLVEMGSVQVVHTPHADLVGPTLRAVQLMRFRPARLHGEPVRVRAVLPVRWVLRQG